MNQKNDATNTLKQMMDQMQGLMSNLSKMNPEVLKQKSNEIKESVPDFYECLECHNKFVIEDKENLQQEGQRMLDAGWVGVMLSHGKSPMNPSLSIQGGSLCPKCYQEWLKKYNFRETTSIKEMF